MYSIDSLMAGGAPQQDQQDDDDDGTQTLPAPSLAPDADAADRTPPDRITHYPHVPNTDVPTRIKPSLNSDNNCAPRQPTSQNDVCQSSGAGEATDDNHPNEVSQSEEWCAIRSPLVLNVPQYSRQPAAGARQELLAVRRTRSKLDLAAKRRRCRRELRAMMMAAEQPHESGGGGGGGGDAPPRHRITYEYGLTIHGYSSESNASDDDDDDDDELSSDVDSERAFDLWIRSGPPLKLSVSGGKAEFLRRFGLTTHYGRSELELEKLERRKWTPSRLISGENDAPPETAARLGLPVPFRSPATLNNAPDFCRKAGFLRAMGLRTVSTTQRQEHERNWLKVVRQRVRRKSLTRLNDFYEHFAERMLAIKEKDDVILSIPKYRDSCMQTECGASSACASRIVRLPLDASLTDGANTTTTMTTTRVLRTCIIPPHATIYAKNNHRPGNSLDDSKEIMNGVVVLKQPQHEVLLDARLMHGIVPPEIDQEMAQMASARQTCDAPETTSATTLTSDDVVVVVRDKRKERKSRAHKHPDWAHWPSLNEMLAVHFKYAKERKMEIKSLQKRLESQKRSVERKQFAVKYYECRHSELRKAATTCNLKRHNMERAVDRLTKIVAAFVAPPDR